MDRYINVGRYIDDNPLALFGIALGEPIKSACDKLQALGFHYEFDEFNSILETDGYYDTLVLSEHEDDGSVLHPPGLTAYYHFDKEQKCQYISMVGEGSVFTSAGLRWFADALDCFSKKAFRHEYRQVSKGGMIKVFKTTYDTYLRNLSPDYVYIELAERFRITLLKGREFKKMLTMDKYMQNSVFGNRS